MQGDAEPSAHQQCALGMTVTQLGMIGMQQANVKDSLPEVDYLLEIDFRIVLAGDARACRAIC